MAIFFKKSGQNFTKRLVKSSQKTLTLSKSHLTENFTSRFNHVKNVKLLVFEWILLLVVIISLSFAQSFWQAESYKLNTFTSGGGYTEGTLGQINSLNPLFATTNSEKTLSKLLFATLSAPDYSGRMGFDLAKSIQTNQTGQTWTIELRNDAVWSDGTPLTTEDVLFTIKTIQNPKVNTSYSSGLSGVKVTAKDQTLTFALPYPYSSFASALNFPILPKHILQDIPPESLLEHNFSKQPVTSGPFLFKAAQSTTTDNTNRILYLSSNPHYFKGESLLNNFSLHTFTDKSAILNAINNGTITATAELSALDQPKITNPEIYQKQTALSSGNFIFFNLSSPALKNRELRHAIQIGLDMRSLRAPLEEESALDFPVIADRIPFLEAPSLPEFDSNKARQIIEKQNISSPIRIVTVNSGYLPALAENLNFQLKNLGLKTELSVHESSQDFLLGILKPRNYDILLYEIELGSDSDLFIYYHSSAMNSGGLNFSNYSNQLSDDLILAARSTVDEKLRANKYRSILTHWVNDIPAIGINRTNLSYYFNRNVRTFSEDNRLVFATDRLFDVQRWSSRSIQKNRTP